MTGIIFATMVIVFTQQGDAASLTEFGNVVMDDLIAAHRHRPSQSASIHVFSNWDDYVAFRDRRKNKNVYALYRNGRDIAPHVRGVVAKHYFASAINPNDLPVAWLGQGFVMMEGTASESALWRAMCRKRGFTVEDVINMKNDADAIVAWAFVKFLQEKKPGVLRLTFDAVAAGHGPHDAWLIVNGEGWERWVADRCG